MNKALKTMTFFVLLLTMFNGIAKAQIPVAFTTSKEYIDSDKKGRRYACVQKTEMDGVKIRIADIVFGSVFEDMWMDIELNLNRSITDGEFPMKNGENKKTVLILLEFEDGNEVYTKLSFLTRQNQTIIAETNFARFVAMIDFERNGKHIEGGEAIDPDVLVELLCNSNISCINVILEGLLTWRWSLNSFQTAATINAMMNWFASETENDGGADTSSNNKAGNSLSKGTWRTQMRKVLDYATHNYNNGDKYKGQVSTVNGIQTRQGLGLYWYNSDYIYWGAFINGILNGYAIDIAAVGKDVNCCPNCVYFVGYYCDRLKCGKGKCYDKDGNLIYYGDFSNDYPIGTYPSIENYTSNKFECIEYKSGDKYFGETYNGQRHGQGIYLWKNGDAWYGPWKDGTRDGYGIYLYYKGNVQYGYSKD